MHTLIDVLKNAATAAPAQALVFYEKQIERSTTYSKLFVDAERNSEIIKSHLGISAGQTVLLHLDSQANYVTWFWSIIIAGAIPVVSTPLAADAVARDRHLQHLKDLLDNPVVITTNDLLGELETLFDLNITSIEDLSLKYKLSAFDNVQNSNEQQDHSPNENDIAFMMLTSGSTGGAKAVEITHAQVIAAVKGKSHILSTTTEDVFLNWIGFDHVACVTEAHLHAMSICAKQVHIDPALPILDPIIWLQKLAHHSVSITFAPNFFLAAVVKAVSEKPVQIDGSLSKLRLVISGGEANKVSTGIAFCNLVKSMGARGNILCPAFGMTETCAGSIYNLDFPEIETRLGLEFCSVGKSTTTIDCRVTTDNDIECSTYQRGNLHLRGIALFEAYHNDISNSKSSFTNDGWFKSADIGYMDREGNLVLVGRSKDSIIINGVKYFSHEIETVAEQAATDFIVPSYTVAFPTWSDENNTEEIIITFVASGEVASDVALVQALDRISNAVFLYCSKKPKTIIPLPLEAFQRSSLGKFSRSNMKTSFELGHFHEEDATIKTRIANYRRKMRKPPESDYEKVLTEVFAEVFSLNAQEVSAEDSIVDMGVDSIGLLRFKSRLQQRLGSRDDLPIGLFLKNPEIRCMAKALSGNSSVAEYEPVVVLQSGKSQATPIWFIHPGLGEVLVFLNISKFFSDRQVFALRAPGFNPGESMFNSIDEMTDTYINAIRQRQPNGPYILIGYSFGSMIAFETTKKLETAGHDVFMASLNGPAHIKWRMIQIDWCELFLNLSYFLGFLTEEEAVKKSREFHQAGYTKEDILGKILAITPSEKLAELDLNADKLAHWANISSQLQRLAHQYDPMGKVQHIDVFYANPLLAVGKKKQKWLEEHLHPWQDFCGEPVRFHDSPGAHYTMLDSDNVFQMQKILRVALKARGLA